MVLAAQISFFVLFLLPGQRPLICFFFLFLRAVAPNLPGRGPVVQAAQISVDVAVVVDVEYYYFLINIIVSTPQPRPLALPRAPCII